MVHIAEDGALLGAGDRTGRTGMHGQPFLFAIARDARTIFTSWNIDWRSVFENAMPVDRQVHLRLIGGDSLIEKRIVVEPMCGMHYVTISGLHNSYCVEIGYFQPADTWNSVAISDEVKMPPQGRADIADIDLATIPFHLGFQQLLDLFRASNGTALANVISDFQKCVTTAEKPEDLSPHEQEILRKLDLSLSEVASAGRGFEQIDREKLARRIRFLAGFSATSPSRPREADWPLAGS